MWHELGELGLLRVGLPAVAGGQLLAPVGEWAASFGGECPGLYLDLSIQISSSLSNVAHAQLQAHSWGASSKGGKAIWWQQGSLDKSWEKRLR